MNICEVKDVQNRGELIEFINILIKELRESPEEWENKDLPSFLEAMSAWVTDMDGYYSNQGRLTPEPNWEMFAQILAAASVYE